MINWNTCCLFKKLLSNTLRTTSILLEIRIFHLSFSRTDVNNYSQAACMQGLHVPFFPLSPLLPSVLLCFVTHEVGKKGTEDKQNSKGQKCPDLTFYKKSLQPLGWMNTLTVGHFCVPFFQSLNLMALPVKHQSICRQLPLSLPCCGSPHTVSC